MINLLGWPMPVVWPLTGFGNNTVVASSIYPIEFYLTLEVPLTFYV